VDKILSFIPGFRSKTKWKMIIASVYYLVVLTSLVGGVSLFLVFLSAPFVAFYFFDLFTYKKRGTTFIKASIPFAVALTVLICGLNTLQPVKNTQPHKSSVVNKAQVTDKKKASVKKVAKKPQDNKKENKKAVTPAKTEVTKAGPQTDADVEAAQKKYWNSLLNNPYNKWNTSDNDAKTNGNTQIAIDALFGFSPENSPEIAIPAAPQDVFKAPFNYYGKMLKIQGRVVMLQEYAPGSNASKVYGDGEHQVAEMAISCPDGTYIDYMNMHDQGGINTGDTVTIYGVPVGYVNAPNRVGGTTMELGIIGNYVEK
jgi:hypothetical protein